MCDAGRRGGLGWRTTKFQKRAVFETSLGLCRKTRGSRLQDQKCPSMKADVDTGRVLGGLEQREHVGTRWAVQLDRCPQAGWRCKLG